jgi:N-terminal acetyltransferase B complex catalytic subunit
VLAKLEASPTHRYPTPPSSYDPGKIPTGYENYLPWHGHITALTISPLARRLGHASLLTRDLERVCDAHDAWFIDLFVREENDVAQNLYRGMGYSVYRRVKAYYSGDTDAFDMRKPLSRDKERKTVREKGEDMEVLPEDVW